MTDTPSLSLNESELERAGAMLVRLLREYERAIPAPQIVPALDRKALVDLLTRPFPDRGIGVDALFREIEEKILKHPAITEVAIVGIPDPKWGEVGIAVCVLRGGQTLCEAELSDWLRPQIASYKAPRRILFWESLPKSGYGKITKAAVKSALAEQGVA